MSSEVEKYENRKKEIASMVLDSNSRVSVDALLVSTRFVFYVAVLDITE